MKTHRDFMQRALELATENVSTGMGGPFGAVIVKDQQIIAEGSNAVTNHHDPTAHAEVQAIRQAAKKLGNENLSGCTIYSSCEPCPMCLGAIYWARLDALYFAADRYDAAQSEFDDERIYTELSKPHNKRSLPTIHLHDLNHLEAFDLWKNSNNKITY